MFRIVSKRLVGTEKERAVSPVIGVILMVAITVILAAVIAAFVLDIGPGEPDPNAVVNVNGEVGDDLEIELTSLDNADAVVAVDESGDIVYYEDTGDERADISTTGQLESYENSDSDIETIQAVRIDDPSELTDDDVEDQTDANAIVENLD